MPESFGPLAVALIGRVQFEREGIGRTVSDLLRTVEVIPLDAAILDTATQMEAEFALSGQDAIVLASVLGHLEMAKPSESCFLSRNSKDFDDPDIRNRLEALKAKFFARFRPALEYVLAQLK